MGDLFDRAKSIFLEAIEGRSPEEWPAFLARACGGDAALRGEIERLLRARSELGSFHEAPRAAPTPTVDEPMRERPGTVIGPYKLVQAIGEGGMGAVYLAQQAEPVRRLVALKVIKPGMDSGQVVARFEAERQALALMDHPNIAKVLDGGATESGRPYFVMELVKGVPLTKYCDEHRLTPKQRLELFVPVCEAVQHAHQKGVIHRDLKPTNVLVALYDGKPVPKVIDFGVAKAAGQPLTDKTLFTGFGAVVGTLEYMSPEQAELNQLDIDTRSDIYSLGVLLYELLTGTTPLERKRLKETGLLEALRLIREEETPRPSARLSTTAELPAIAASRGLEPKKLSGAIRGELDWIVMKALEKDRNRRYESASAFAADVQRYLHDEPVQACPPSAWYRLRKFGRRNRAALATLSVVAAALLTTVVVLVISNISIRQQEKEKSQALVAKDAALTDATASRQQAEANLSLILAALDEVYISEAEKRLAVYRNEPHTQEPNQPELTLDPRPAQVDRDFLQKGMSFYEKLIQPGRAEPAARFQTGKAYRRVGVLQWELKQYDKAAEALEKAGSLLDELAKQSPTEPQYRWELAQAYRWQGQVWPNRKVPQRAEAAQAFRRAAALAEELAAESPSNRDYRMHAATCLVSAGGALAAMKRTPDAEAEYLEGLKLWQQLVADVPKERWYRHELAFNLDSLGWLWEGANQPEKAEPFFRQALAYHEKLVAEDATIDDSPVRLARTHQHLAQVLTRMGRLPEAEMARREALAVLEKLDPKDAGAWYGRGLAYLNLDEYDKAIADLNKAIQLDPKSAPAHNALGVALDRQGKRDEALAEYRKAIELDPNGAYAHSNLGIALRDQGKLEEAIAECRKAIALDPTFAPAHCGLGATLAKQGKLDEAIAECRKAIALDPNGAYAHSNLGGALSEQGKLDEAIAECRKAIALDPKCALAHNNLAGALHEQGKRDEAVAEYKEVLRIKPDFPEARYNLGNDLREEGKLDEAVAEFHKAIALKPDLAEAHCGLGLVLAQQGEFRQALEELRRGHELGSRRPTWRYPSAQWVRQAERLVELDAKLPSILTGEAKPANTDECVELALVCVLYKKLNRAGADLFARAFAEQPQLAEDLGPQHRYNAACAAALAGCGQGKDADQSDARERTRLRRQALDWLRADLAAWGRLLEKEPDKTAPVLAATMQHWQQDTDLAGVRGQEALAKLPEAERQEWPRLWNDVAEMLKRAQAKK
jgi:tetratricopeptide (TPR) repeat protein